MKRGSAHATLAALALADSALLVLLAPSLGHLGQLARLTGWVARDGGDRVLAELAEAAMWLGSAWLGVALALVGASVVPGALGDVASRVAGSVAPASLRRLGMLASSRAAGLAGIAGMAIVLTPVAAGATTPSPSAPAPGSVATPAPAWPTQDRIPSPAWPADQPASRSRPTRVGAAHPTATHPTATHPTAAHPTAAHRATPATDHRDLRGQPILVRTGDTLWSIAAARLGDGATSAQVARAWPSWYAANRAVIGDDPNLIHPGQRLRAPATTQGHPTGQGEQR